MVGEVVAPRYRQTTVLSVEDADPQEKRLVKCRPLLRKGKETFTTQMNAGGVEEWDTLHENVRRTSIRQRP